MFFLRILACVFVSYQISEGYSSDRYAEFGEGIVARHIGEGHSLTSFFSGHALSPAFFKVFSKAGESHFLKFTNIEYDENRKLKDLEAYVERSLFKNEINAILIIPFIFGEYNDSTNWNISRFCDGTELEFLLQDFLLNPIESGLSIFTNFGVTVARLHKYGNFRYEDGSFVSDLVHKDLHPYNIFYKDGVIQLVDNSNFFLTNNLIEDISHALLQSTPFPMLLHCYAIRTLKSLRKYVSDKDQKFFKFEKPYMCATANFLKSYVKTVSIEGTLLNNFVEQLSNMLLQKYPDFYMKDGVLRTKLIPELNRLYHLDRIRNKLILKGIEEICRKICLD